MWCNFKIILNYEIIKSHYHHLIVFGAKLESQEKAYFYSDFIGSTRQFDDSFCRVLPIITVLLFNIYLWFISNIWSLQFTKKSPTHNQKNSILTFIAFLAAATGSTAGALDLRIIAEPRVHSAAPIRLILAVVRDGQDCKIGDGKISLNWMISNSKE